MEKIEKNTLTVPSVSKIKRLSIVDSIDSLSLFTYNHSLELIDYSYILKSSISIGTYLSDIVKKYGDIDYRLYYTVHDFEILPRKLFLYSNEQSYVEKLAPSIKKGNIVFVDRCAEQQLVIVYPVSASKDVFYREIFRGLHTYHIASAFVKSTNLSTDMFYSYVIGEQVYHYHSLHSTFQCLFTRQLDTLDTELANIWELYDIQEAQKIVCGDTKRLKDQFQVNNQQIIEKDLISSLDRIKY